MRTITINDLAVEVRPLTRKEIKAGRELGLGYMVVDLTKENFDAVCDYCLNLQFDADYLDALSSRDLRTLFLALIAETWGSEDEEKNSSGSGPKDQTPN